MQELQEKFKQPGKVHVQSQLAVMEKHMNQLHFYPVLMLVLLTEEPM